MPRIVKKLKDSTEHTPYRRSTLASIASKECEDWVTWDVIAQFNWGTSQPEEVVRAMAETVGIRIDGVFDAFGKLKIKPEEVKFDPDNDLPKKIRLPAQIDEVTLAIQKRHEIRVKQMKPAIAVAITALDKWFIPEVEECDIGYSFYGLAENANKAQLDVYGSNYCWCSDYAKGIGKFTADTKPFEKIPLFTEDADIEPLERGLGNFKWKGQIKPSGGMLKHKSPGQDKRHVNVAFSPYTVQLGYWKSDENSKAQLQLLPFWPQFETKDKTVALTPTYKPNEGNATSIEFAYDNAEEVEGGWLTVKDDDGQLVWRKALKDDNLKKGARKITWDGTYDKLALNGVMKNKLINDSAKSDDEIREEGYLFRSWPYVFELKTYKRVYMTAGKGTDPDPSLIKWKLIEAKKLERGLIQVFDKDGKMVWLKGIPKSKLANGTEHEIKWDGKYATGVKNSKDGDVAIEADMPYRVQIQVHTAENTDLGLALASMHSEVRLYVPQGLYAPEDPRRDLIDPPQAMLLSRAKAWPRKTPPASGQTVPYYQYALTNAGYHPGPVTGVDNDHLKCAIREFKRSVPKDVVAGAGAFTRHPLGSVVINARTADMTTCLGSPELSPRWTRKIWGDRTEVDNNSHTPYHGTEQDIDDALADPKGNIILWVDDRQYYTNPGAPGSVGHGYGPKGVDMLGVIRPLGKALGVGDPAPDTATIASAKDWGLHNYRGGMAIGDTSVTHDKDHISQPWVPFKVELRLLGKGDALYPKAKDAAVKVDDADRRAAMRRAIGPLRVDWSVHDALYDVSTIDAANYAVNPEPEVGHGAIREFRTRRYVAGALYAARRRHKRKDEAFESQFWNCRKDPHEVGKVPDDMDKYHREVFAEGQDNSLLPWMALHHDDEEATASIVHDHIVELKDGATAQKLDETLIEPEIGAAGIWFNPAITAGDGYRLRAEVKFKEAGDYKFPNLKVLAARYPVTPQAHTCEIRLWRRSTLRGYTKWSPSAGTDAQASRWTNATINQIRKQYKTGHVYMTLDGADTLAELELDLAALFNNFGPAEQQTMQKFVKWHSADNWIADITQAQAQENYNWPWSHRDDLGRPGHMAFNIADFPAKFGEYLGQFDEPQWDKLTGAILYWISSKFEANGHMRGHMMVDFKDSPPARVYAYFCQDDPAHTAAWLHVRRRTAGSDPPHPKCPSCPPLTANPLREHPVDVPGISLAAIGLAVGSSWLFPGDGDLWAHEIGHHKHLEHAASAGGRVAGQHDDGANADVPATATPLWPYVAGVAGNGVNNVDDRQWDRRCVMSYANWDGGTRLFCGKCAMRNRGWKYGHVANPADDVNEPA